MKRPWQIWIAYLLCLVVSLPSLGWLTVKALELDRAEATARRQAELEQNVSLALWRMDTALGPLLAQEAARPHVVYQSFYPSPASPQKPLVSPLLQQRSAHVKVHFTLAPQGELTSPQCPADRWSGLALSCGLSEQRLSQNTQTLDELKGQLDYDRLCQLLPKETLPSLAAEQKDQKEGQAAKNESVTVYNTLSMPNVRQELDISQQQAMQAPASVNRHRSGEELQQRDRALKSIARSQYVEQRNSYNSMASKQPADSIEGVSKPLWIGDKLILARRVTQGDTVLVQGCWLDWPAIRTMLLSETKDLLPRAELEPVVEGASVQLFRLLATLPVQLVTPPPEVGELSWSPIRLSLVVAWACLTVAAVAVAVVLRGVVGMSERRAAFVSAVTHELRTPLTTLRMYAEMLEGDMLPDEAARGRYLSTLRGEADRLSHLVENVLAYARLERGRIDTRREQVALGELRNRIEPRLAQRAEQAEMTLNVQADAADAEAVVETDPGAVEQILFNLVDNASKYAASAARREIEVTWQIAQDALRVAVRDYGPGIQRRQARRLFRPFSKTAQEAAHSAPGVGLGLALSRRLARDIGGRLEYTGGDDGAEFILTLPRK